MMKIIMRRKKMTKEEALKKRPCNKCVHQTRCQIVDYMYSPCYETDKDGNDYHGAFEPKTDSEED